jgi:hypothetical protein
MHAYDAGRTLEATIRATDPMALILNRDGMASELLHLHGVPPLSVQVARAQARSAGRLHACVRAGRPPCPFEFEMGVGASVVSQKSELVDGASVPVPVVDRSRIQ